MTLSLRNQKFAPLWMNLIKQSVQRQSDNCANQEQSVQRISCVEEKGPDIYSKFTSARQTRVPINALIAVSVQAVIAAQK